MASNTLPPRPRLRVPRLLASGALAAGILAVVTPAHAAECVQLGILQLCKGASTAAAPAPAPSPTVPPAPPTTVRAPAPTPPPVPPPVVGVVGDDLAGARRLLEIVNVERVGRGLPALAARDDVTAIATEHSRRMAAAGRIFHNSEYFSARTKELLGAKARGENVAMNTTIEGAHAGLMGSSGHRANLLDARFTVAGFAVVRDDKGVAYITQNFLQPGSAAARPRAATTAPRPQPAAPAPAPEPQSAPAPEPPVEPEAAPVVDGPVELALPEQAAPVPQRPPAPTRSSRSPAGVLTATALVLFVSRLLTGAIRRRLAARSPAR